MIQLLPKAQVDFKKEVTVTVGLSADVEMDCTGVIAALKDDGGSLYLEKSNGNIMEFRSYIYFEIHIGGKDE